jgi:thiol-disulfide isomerase/thioredoxin
MINAPRDSRPTVTLFSAPGCHLCDEARALLAQYEASHGLTVEAVNIRSSPELEQEFGLRIPVARFPYGGELSWPFTGQQVRAALERAQQP